MAAALQIITGNDMQQVGAGGAPPPQTAATAAPFLRPSIFSTTRYHDNNTINTNNRHSYNPPVSPTQRTHRSTHSVDSTSTRSSHDKHKDHHKERNVLVKRSSSIRRKSSSKLSVSTSNKRHTVSTTTKTNPPSGDGDSFCEVQAAALRPPSDHLVPPLPSPTHPTHGNHHSQGRLSKMLSRGAVTPVSGYPVNMTANAALAQQSELASVHQHIQDTVNKRISTLDYLRKAHEGRIYWFNTLLFDKPDIQRMPYFDPRKLGRRATNYLLLGISLPAVIDLNSSTPTDFLRSLNNLLTEFDAFQQIHTENGVAATSLTRARLPQMFRRAAAPVSKGRRSSSAAGRDAPDSIGIGYDSSSDLASSGGGGGAANGAAAGPAPGAVVPTGPAGAAANAPAAAAATPEGVMAFAASEVDLLPGEEYTYLLTPTLPFDPDFFETFATLCDVLIDTYSRLLSLVPTPRECGGAVGELFAKADSKIRKLFIQGAVREFEESARAGLKAEVASVGKVVLSGLM